MSEGAQVDRLALCGVLRLRGWMPALGLYCSIKLPRAPSRPRRRRGLRASRQGQASGPRERVGSGMASFRPAYSSRVVKSNHLVLFHAVGDPSRQRCLVPCEPQYPAFAASRCHAVASTVDGHRRICLDYVVVQRWIQSIRAGARNPNGRGADRMSLLARDPILSTCSRGFGECRSADVRGRQQRPGCTQCGFVRASPFVPIAVALAEARPLGSLSRPRSSRAPWPHLAMAPVTTRDRRNPSLPRSRNSL